MTEAEKAALVAAIAVSISRDRTDEYDISSAIEPLIEKMILEAKAERELDNWRPLCP